MQVQVRAQTQMQVQVRNETVVHLIPFAVKLARLLCLPRHWRSGGGGLRHSFYR